MLLYVLFRATEMKHWVFTELLLCNKVLSCWINNGQIVSSCYVSDIYICIAYFSSSENPAHPPFFYFYNLDIISFFFFRTLLEPCCSLDDLSSFQNVNFASFTFLTCLLCRRCLETYTRISSPADTRYWY
jgi:hypothetical protein